MPEKETRTTATFPVEREDGSQEVVIEKTTFLIHKGDGYEAAIQMEWFLNGDSLIRDPTDKDVFRKGITGETFRKLR